MTSSPPESLAALLDQVIAPVLAAMFEPGEVEGVHVSFAQAYDHRVLRVRLQVAGGEEVDTHIDVSVGASLRELRARFGSDVEDLVAESRFAWGQWRRNPFPL